MDRKDAYVITQPVWPAERQSGMFWNDPPVSSPAATVTVEPKRNAEIILSWAGCPSISSRINRVRI